MAIRGRFQLVTIVRVNAVAGTARVDNNATISLIRRKPPRRRVDSIGMKISKRLAGATIGLGLLAGCANDAGNGALIGGGVGALAGGIIGHQTGHAMGGALIGGAIGAGTGALIGHASDENKIDKQRQYDRGYDDARADGRYTGSPAPSSGYYSSSETTRSSLGSGGYQSSRTVTQSSTSTTYYR